MRAVNLCSGQGTGIRDVADDIPKPKIRIADWPILWRMLGTYGTAGINYFVLCLGDKSLAIKECALNLRAQRSDLTISPGWPVKVDDGAADSREAEWQIVLAETGLATQSRARLWNVSEWRARNCSG